MGLSKKQMSETPEGARQQWAADRALLGTRSELTNKAKSGRISDMGPEETSDGTSVIEEEAIPPLEVYSTLLTNMPDAPLFDELRASHERRGMNLLHLSTVFSAGLQGINSGCVWLTWMVQRANDQHLADLVRRIRDDAVRATEAILMDDHATSNDIARDLMEIDVLLRDFTRKPGQLGKWVSATSSGEDRGFGFGKIVDRLRAAAKVEQGWTLPDTHEYQAHSVGLHPTAHARQRMSDETDGMAILNSELSDLINHLTRCVVATQDLAKVSQLFEDLRATEGGSDDPGFDQLLVANEICKSIAQTQIEAIAQATGQRMPDRGPYRRGSSFFEET